MKTLKALSIILLVLVSIQKGYSQNMNNDKLGKILYVLADSIEGVPGNWKFKIQDRTFLCLTDEYHNRMRIVSPIIEQDKLSYPDLIKSLTANFHTVLDVKYALSDEILWSVFIHPLKELTKNQVIDAVEQVYAAANTYGSVFSSTNLVFPNKKQTPSSIKKQ